MSSAQQFNDRIAETQSGANEVQDFALKTSYLFPSADVLVPAPLAVSILGQLTLVATATDFRLIQPPQGFKHVRYPDSFRATVMQLVNTGALALNQSFANFSEINQRCSAVRPGVNNIVQLLVGHQDNTPRENEQAIERHLPNQIESLRKTIETCLEKAKETDDVFNQLLELTMEIHESCTATQGVNEGHIQEANVRKSFLEEERKAAETMRQIGEQAAEKAREDFTNAQKQFNTAADSMPGGWTIAGLEILDTLTGAANVITLGLLKLGKRSSSGSSSQSSAAAHSSPAGDMSDVHDPGYQKANMLRNLTELLHTLMTSGDDGRPDWNAIRSPNNDGCIAVRVGFEQVIKSIKPNHPHAGRATTEVIGLAREGIEYARKLGAIVPPGSQDDLARLTADVSALRQKVLAFASEADVKLGTPLIPSNAFLPEQNFSSGSGSSAELAVRSAQYRLAATGAQLNASRESSKAASDKMMEVNGQLGDILAQIAKVDVQKQDWEKITKILLKAIYFLCELKKYLNNLVHFFDSVHVLVSVTLKHDVDQFIQILKDATAIENAPGKEPRKIGGITLDAWARQAIYDHALDTAKISRVVENISGMYVTLYDSNVHPGVNMLLGMGALVGSKDGEAVAKAVKELQDWAKAASDGIVQLVRERTQANERDIQARMLELEKSLGGILPPSAKIDEIVGKAEKEQVKENTRAFTEAVNENPVYRKQSRAFV